MNRAEQIADNLRARITAGEYPPGTKLPSVHWLASVMFGVAEGTIHRAEVILEAEGWVEIRQGTGVIVLDTPPERITLEQLASRVTELERRAHDH